MARKLKLTSAGVILTDGKGGGDKLQFCRITNTWRPVAGSTSPKAKSAPSAKTPAASVKPSATSKPAQAAKPVNPVLASLVTHFGKTRASVLYCDHGGHSCTMADAQRIIREDIQAKAAAKAEADAFNALLNSPDASTRFGAHQVARLRGTAKASPATATAAVTSAPVRAAHIYRKYNPADRKEGRDVAQDFAKGIAQRMQAAK